MRIIKYQLYTYLFLLCLLSLSCKSQKKDIQLPVFKGFKLYTTKKQFNKHADSLIKNDPSFNLVFDDEKPFIEFKEKSSGGLEYYGYVLPTIANDVVTNLTIFYCPESYPATVAKYIAREEQTLVYWGDLVNKIYNDLNLKLQIKYGADMKTGTTVSHHKISDYTYLVNEWQHNELSIKLMQEVEKDDGTNRFPFCNFLIVYGATDRFKTENEKYIDDLQKKNNPY